MEVWIIVLVIGGAGAGYAAFIGLPRLMTWMLNPPTTRRRTLL